MTLDQSKIDPELAGTQTPFVLSIEPCNRPTFKHGYHLGTDERIARRFAEQTFTQHHENNTALYTVALMRDGKIFDVYDGRSWFSDDMEKLVNAEHGITQLIDARKAHGGELDIPTLPSAYKRAVQASINSRRVTAIRPNPRGEGYVLVTEDVTITTNDAWSVIERDQDLLMAHTGEPAFTCKRDYTLWDAVCLEKHKRREIAAALVRGAILFW